MLTWSLGFVANCHWGAPPLASHPNSGKIAFNIGPRDIQAGNPDQQTPQHAWSVPTLLLSRTNLETPSTGCLKCTQVGIVVHSCNPNTGESRGRMVHWRPEASLDYTPGPYLQKTFTPSLGLHSNAGTN